MQAAGHDEQHGTGGIVPALAKNARTGHPLFWNGKENTKGWATRQGTTSAEIYYQDLQCAVGLGTGSCSGLDQTSYKAAIVSLAAGQPAAASVLFGTANAVGTTQIF
jgi:hypothetical protein